MREREGEGEIKIDPKEWVRLRGIQRRKWERKSGGGHERMWQEERLKGWGVGTWREETSQRKSRSLCKQWILWRGGKWEHGLEGKEDAWAGGRRRSMQGLGGGRWSAGRVEQEETTHAHEHKHTNTHTPCKFDLTCHDWRNTHLRERGTRVQSAGTKRCDIENTFGGTRAEQPTLHEEV